MAKDRKARHEVRMTVVAIANVIAAIVDTMRDGDVPNDIIHIFLDQLERMNEATMEGIAGMVLGDVVAIIRASVPGND